MTYDETLLFTHIADYIADWDHPFDVDVKATPWRILTFKDDTSDFNQLYSTYTRLLLTYESTLTESH